MGVIRYKDRTVNDENYYTANDRSGPERENR